VQSLAVTVTTTATLVVAADDKNRTVYLHNPSGVKMYLGGSTVTTTTGFHLDNGDTLTIELPLRETLHGIVAAGSHDVVVLRPDAD
jgi:hypothetical protein